MLSQRSWRSHHSGDEFPRGHGEFSCWRGCKLTGVPTSLLLVSSPTPPEGRWGSLRARWIRSLVMLARRASVLRGKKHYSRAAARQHYYRAAARQHYYRAAARSCARAVVLLLLTHDSSRDVGAAASYRCHHTWSCTSGCVHDSRRRWGHVQEVVGTFC